MTNLGGSVIWEFWESLDMTSPCRVFRCMVIDQTSFWSPLGSSRAAYSHPLWNILTSNTLTSNPPATQQQPTSNPPAIHQATRQQPNEPRIHQQPTKQPTSNLTNQEPTCNPQASPQAIHQQSTHINQPWYSTRDPWRCRRIINSTYRTQAWSYK